MNKTSTEKITLATPFLIWFRRTLPESTQTQVRLYLDRPYQLALQILDCCSSAHSLNVNEIAAIAGVSPETARQALLALKQGGMPFAAVPGRGWQVAQEDAVTPVSPDGNSLTHPEDPCPPFDASGIDYAVAQRN